MPSLIDIRRRIRSVRNTQQITKAMKMVSAAKLRRAQDQVISARPYASLLHKVLSNLAVAASEEGESANPLLARRSERRILLLLFTSDTGLAAAFNSNLIKAAQKFIEDHREAELEFEAIGRKGRDFFRKRGARISAEHIGILGKPRYEDAVAIGHGAIERFRAGEIDAVYVLNNEFKSMVAQRLAVSRLLPVEIPQRTEAVDYIFEQPPNEMLESLLPRYVVTEVFRSMLETAAAYHAARMMAMEAATSNAGKMIETLTLYMNRVRQASITKELIEVVSGAAAAE
ncbi:MAG: ATP synthase F1 subunit gamma [Acidobacteriia bacterium]|nr:ATP synthase F1 subunit gamma [Terriglobia bacterium]